VLDGYAGTGAAGIEALSRGASSVTFVERDRRAQALIADNLAHCGVADGYVIIRADMARAIGQLRAAGLTFDIALLDPPYDQSADAELAALADLLAPGGIAVFEHPRRRHAPEHAARLSRTRDVFSGDSALSFYE
jgi:16S rRNA (guanine966-N2)-methyltransferase